MEWYGPSCPSRGTWIEIRACLSSIFVYLVVPLTGHVDRNVSDWALADVWGGRAPHGARG